MLHERDMSALRVNRAESKGIPKDEDAGQAPHPALPGVQAEVHASGDSGALAGHADAGLRRELRKPSRLGMGGPMNIVELGFRIAERVGHYRELARRFFYEVVLSDQHSPCCGAGLSMCAEGRCRCDTCGGEFDPTPAFQRCPGCGGSLELAVRRYRCTGCGADVASRFLFEGLVFDAAYFRRKMAESRQRRREQRERVRLMLLGTRSPHIEPGWWDPASTPGLLEALDGFVGAERWEQWGGARSKFDLGRYQSHIQAHLAPFPIWFEQIPSLAEDARRDRIWRFIALIFMDHSGRLELEQQRERILVMPRASH